MIQIFANSYDMILALMIHFVSDFATKFIGWQQLQLWKKSQNLFDVALYECQQNDEKLSVPNPRFVADHEEHKIKQQSKQLTRSEV